MQTIFTFLNKIKQHGYICHYQFSLTWYDKVWQFISKKYNFILWISFFLQIFGFKTWKIKTTSHKIYWDNHSLQKLSPPPLWSTLMGLQCTPRLITNPQHWYWGGLELCLRLLRKNPNKLCFIELSQNSCEWLQLLRLIVKKSLHVFNEVD